MTFDEVAAKIKARVDGNVISDETLVDVEAELAAAGHAATAHRSDADPRILELAEAAGG